MSIGVICDGCDFPCEYDLLSTATAWVGNAGYRPAVANNSQLERHNWVEADGSHYCPDCVAAMVMQLGGHGKRWRA